MTVHEFAAREQAKHFAKFEAFRRRHLGAEASAKEALLKANSQLGDQSIPGYAEFLQNMGNPFGVVHKELEKMRSLLLATNRGPELAACTSEHLPIILTFDREVNAEVRASSVGGMPVVCLDMAVYHWLAFLNRMLMRCAEAGTDRDKRKGEFLGSIRPWTEGWLFDRYPANADAIEQLRVESCREPFGTFLSVQLTDWQLLWILAHEFAHVAFKHPLCEALPSEASRRNEYEADARATKYFLAAINDLTVTRKVDAVVLAQEWSSAVPLILLMFFTYAETVRWGLQRLASQSHPLAQDRVKALVATFGDTLTTPAASTFCAFAQALILRACCQILDERKYPRPVDLPEDVDLKWKLGERIG